jgi:predicted GH43/DUF377 family glycosyl hydrolase
MRGQPVRWARNHIFNPAAVVLEDEVHLLVRAEDGEGDHIGQYTSRIGDAVSADGLTFQLRPRPVVYPDQDEWVGEEWYGGCEDPRVVEGPDGDFAIYYTMYNRGNPKEYPKNAVLGVATSRDLVHWKKHGPIFSQAGGLEEWHKAAGVVQEVKDGRLVAAKIDGKFWMYWGEDAVRLATSTDLIHWTPVRTADGKLLTVVSPRKGYFDSIFTEVGPPPVLTEHGIVLIYNGKNCAKDGDRSIGGGAYAAGQLLFDRNDPTKVLDRLDTPFLKPELPFERTGQYPEGTVFVEGLVLFKGKWFLYYGTADTYIGVATAPGLAPA